ncbi:hypothetical protein LEMA_P066430.1 [Plenodomus lingam JN3]|uniref:Major facilitator superfamily (MFS) profile domain-containing protein n=1 Tax=Leptosphaeria maculans (strain JN3 / isolate v23.1.3 / race Av1-4-5-6-7-8) TaxID=985895 RepID=E4ZGU7_LEPMJ|nr:hypothetical protein LEMA_P066430.1 [Plenodomus lingam JN3]CBX90517.1 hypothetical protein LEMA_P066430.1 [Plenodomus lingam JN3]
MFRSTTSPTSTINGVKKSGILKDDAPATEERAMYAPQPPPVSYPKGIEVLAIMLALVLSITLISLDQTIVATAIPKITDQFNQLDDISWYASAYFLTLGAFQSLWGKVYKYFPLKTSFLVAIFIFEVRSLISAVAQNSVTLIVGRAISRLGGLGIAPRVYTISAFAAEPTKRATYTGIISMSYSIAAVAGPLISGGLTNRASWRYGLAAFVILLTFKTPQAVKVVDTTLKEKLLHIDFLGTALVMGASLTLLLALQYASVTYAWNSSVIISLLVGFVAIMMALTIGFFFAGSSGVRNIPLIVLFSIATYRSGTIITKIGNAAPYLTVSSVIVTIATSLFFTLNINTLTGKWIGYQIFAGFGYGLALQVPVIVAQAFATPADIAPTTAIIICGIFLLAAAQAGFVNQLRQRLAITALSVNPILVTETGATKLHQIFSRAKLEGVIRAYA